MPWEHDVIIGCTDININGKKLTESCGFPFVFKIIDEFLMA